MWFKTFSRMFKNPPGIPNYGLGPRYDVSGAAAFVMLPEYGQPLLSIAGPGNIPLKSLMVTQQPPLYYTSRGTIFGLGGNQAGQFSLSPLTDSENQ